MLISRNKHRFLDNLEKKKSRCFSLLTARGLLFSLCLKALANGSEPLLNLRKSISQELLGRLE
ncbi:hypothetical protein [Helicobacter felistomachi]|uniref:hypothetical protein n=1 Tax=Helicobacter felistomachi TaxID=3040201 RepID=UPI002573BF66|nr:hypothetical protein [Helicobacter sp. NHP21005]